MPSFAVQGPRLIPAVAFLLDSLSVPALVAYSTRKLASAYAGNALQVTRSSDSTTLNIGFVGSNLDTSSLLSFVGAGTGTVTIWYDQSGNGLNAAPLAGSSAPSIVVSGSLNTLNTHASIVYTNAANMNLAFNRIQSQPVTIAILAKLSTVSTTGQHFTDGQSTLRLLMGVTTGPAYQLFAGNVLTGGTPDTNTHTLIGIFNTTSSSMIVDGSTIISGSVGTSSWGDNSSGNQPMIGAGQGPSAIGGQIPEYIGFGSVLSGADQATIRSSWQSYWGAP